MESEYISKERLREIIGDVNEVCPYKVPGDYDTYSQYNEGWQDACNTIESMIDAEDGTEMVPLDYHERCLELEVERRMQGEKPDRVVTCKDCAHLCYEDIGIYYCDKRIITGQLDPDDYCSRAAKKEEK